MYIRMMMFIFNLHAATFLLGFLHVVAEGSSRDPARQTFQLDSEDSAALQWDIATVKQARYGSCTYEEVSREARSCESDFFKALIRGSPYNCQRFFGDLQTCINSKWDQCLPNTTSRRAQGAVIEAVRNYKVFLGASYCNDGALSLPHLNQPINYCTPEYEQTAARCIRRYHNSFRRNPSQVGVCEEYYAAKTCLYAAQDEMCLYEDLLSLIKKANRDLYRCWNPYCVWRKPPWSDWQPENLSSRRRTRVAQTDSNSRRGIPSDCEYNTAGPVPEVTVADSQASTLNTYRYVKDQTIRPPAAKTPSKANINTAWSYPQKRRFQTSWSMTPRGDANTIAPYAWWRFILIGVISTLTLFLSL